ncbi:hypothetical protein [Occallatibacter riparius]|uniref:Uncharacterized protein n=1 Tax=Occallatibacter riparius TaxID=1002689 RepID=A0A9J7BVA3_9BACT|nr:hypothetical protein [Occallatibacter riparius]UWZ86481.1 hypothetical protein MOP44_11170 [Occallatibacter riparius]
MTNQTYSAKSLGGSQAGMVSRWRTLLVATMVAGGLALAAYAQEPTTPPAAGQPAAPQQPATPPKPAPTQAKPPADTNGKTMGGYQVHSMVDLGGRFAEKNGSRAMWATMVNQTTGARVLGQEVQMHTVDPHKTPFFDTLSSSSFGYGGDPYDATYLSFSKGKWYDFGSSFRRSRQYFDYNLLVNSLLGPNQLVPQPNSLHLYNTVRRNTDTLLTVLPVSLFSFRAGYNHNTHEGPSYSTIHQGGDVQENMWFRNATDTWVGGVDYKPFHNTTVSYDQFLVFYKGDTNYHLAPPPFVLPNGQPVTVGVNLLTTSKCGTSGTANYTLAVVNGVVNPFCSGTTTEDQTAPTRTSFPTEQMRFASKVTDKLVMNGRFLYSGGNSRVNSFNQTFIGLNSRTLYREIIDTGALPNGHLANNKRINVNGDFSVRAEINPIVAVSDVVDYWDVRVPGETAWNEFTLKGVATQKGPPVKYGTSMLTPLNDPSLTANTVLNTDSHYLAHKNIGNTALGIFTITPQVKLTGGWRFNNREISLDDDPTLAWHQNWLLIGSVLQPSSMFRLNLNYELMHSSSSGSATTTNTYTREAPNRINDFRARAQIKPAHWISVAAAGILYYAENNDPTVNHKEHNNDFSFNVHVTPRENMGLDVDFAHDSVYSRTDLCYQANPAPPDAVPGGYCTNSASGNTLLGNGLYEAPMTFFNGMFNYAGSKWVGFDVGGRVNHVTGSAEMLNPNMVPGALDSTYWYPYANLIIHIAPKWSWHGDWNRPDYAEAGAPGPAPRNFNGNIFTLGVKHQF